MMRTIDPMIAATIFFAFTSHGALANTDSKEFDQSMAPILAAYLQIQVTLAGDKTGGVTKAAEAIATSASKIDPKKITGKNAKVFSEISAKVATMAKALKAAKTLAEMRTEFKVLSEPMGAWARIAKPTDVMIVHCSMANGSWLQKRGDKRNPYFGSSMLRCGHVVFKGVPK